MEATAERLFFTVLQQQRTDAAAGVAGIDEERANFRSLSTRIELRGITPGPGVVYIVARTLAPRSAAMK